MLPAGGAGGGGLLGGLLGGGAGRELQALADQGGAREAAVRAAGVPYTVVRVGTGWDRCGGLLPCGANGREGVEPTAHRSRVHGAPQVRYRTDGQEGAGSCRKQERCPKVGMDLSAASAARRE